MFFVSNAYAQSAGAAEPNPMVTIAMFVGLFAFMYFLIIRPQRKRTLKFQKVAVHAVLPKGTIKAI